ncbi:hypothetical protein BO70DRAFT_392941 [Aspergillus heteromorphus CBS 117.55]|uniref:Luciferase domain-containing protein n=1 Tax=Aspergillus heteromorphus CBS 117.55 TaxID=1448321 RepID=A0A317WX06_9EURO|nr:uncharacterized protein BO70DRAFT_392941 [Aspergillus heteromorphus CBS 117.55]PWY89727.1 hypothetical protein BO70DRAFT_392941 [Aspergillus heteromorphus CBS 117.55]
MVRPASSLLPPLPPTHQLAYHLLSTHQQPPDPQTIPLPIAIPLTNPPILLLLTLPTLLLTHLILKDYHAFLALGPGGTPSTPLGYLRICMLRLFTIRDPFHPPSIPSTLLPQSGLLSAHTLSPRPGPRPTVIGIAPQRQMSQKSGLKMYELLSREIQDLVARHPGELYEGTSCFEKHSTGIFCTGSSSPSSSASTTSTTSSSSSASSSSPPSSSTTHPTTQAKPIPISMNNNNHTNTDISPTILSQHQHRRTCNGEVCHAHPSDGSLHLTLHPADVKLVIERGWAQRHPLTRESWWWCYMRTVPTGFVMVYAPRNEAELACVLEIIRAAAWWAEGSVEPAVGPKDA